MAGSLVTIFVEGETEKEFYDTLLSFYSQNSKKTISEYKVFNLKGIGRFENKVSSKLKHEIIPKFPEKEIKVICCYDSDVFELAQKPPVNWKLVKKKVNELGINNFNEIVAISMIEDWFIKDIDGLCKYLKIKKPKKINGKNGYEKMKFLFKIGNKPKVYQKGTNTHKFIPNLDLNKIRVLIKEELIVLETALGAKL